jgi:cytochrome oxidase Cu insertion factor (SCO1/SenC/PrrC family)
MNPKSKIILLYVGVVAVSAAIIGLAMFLRSGMPKPELAENVGRQTEQEWFPIQRDLTGVNQAGEHVKLSDLKGKVWIVAEFFAICPHCAQRNGAELRAIYDEFKSNPDFQIVCISVDPTQDSVERLKEYAAALGADSKNWWFVNAGDEKATHEYMEKELKFFGIRERTNPSDIDANGRFSHDLAFMMVDRNWQVVGKWPLAEARSEEAQKRQPELYETLKTDLYGRLRAELGKPSSSTK